MRERLQKQVGYLDLEGGVAVVGSACVRINGDGKELDVMRYPTGDKEIREILSRYNPFLHSSVMVRKSALDEVGRYRNIFRFAQDYDLWLRISERYRLANLNDPLIKYRLALEGITIKRMHEQLLFRDLARAVLVERQERGNDGEYLERFAAEERFLQKNAKKIYRSEVEQHLLYLDRILVENGDKVSSRRIRAYLFRNNPGNLRYLKGYVRSYL